VISVCIGLVCGTFSAASIFPHWWVGAVIVALVLALPGFFWPQAVSIPYKVWNRLAHYFAWAAGLVLSGICFYIVIVAVGRTGSSLALGRPTPGKSLWSRRLTVQPAAYTSLDFFARERSPQRSWISAFFSWAARAGNLWAVCLFPFLLLLSALETGKARLSPNVYTLY